MKTLHDSAIRPSMGSVSHATLRLQDLIPSFIHELRWMKADKPYAGLSNLAKLSSSFDDDHSFWTSEEAVYDLEHLTNRLESIASNIPFCYFGTSEGDGSDFGFWFDSYGLDTAIEDEEAVVVETLPTDRRLRNLLKGKWAGAFWVVQQNERGNRDIYEIKHLDGGNVTLESYIGIC